MWKALENILIPLNKNNGKLVISIYNNQGIKSKYWEKIKSFYCSGTMQAFLVKLFFIPYSYIIAIFLGIVKYKNIFGEFKARNGRGMKFYFDCIDWLGGYPYEYAKPEEIISFFNQKGLELIKLRTTNSLGCNEFVFQSKSKI